LDRQFAGIVACGFASRFAGETEGTAADIATAADAQAPDGAWRSKVELPACARRDRVDKLTVIRQEVDERILEPIHCPDRGDYPGAFDQDPAATWPAVVEQLIATEQDAARSGTKGVA